MAKFSRKVGCLGVLLLTCGLLLAPVPARAVVIIEVMLEEIALATSTGTPYAFTGQCTDCTGQGTATLRLQDYTPGDPVQLSDFVSFQYAGTNLLDSFLVVSSAFPTLFASGSGVVSIGGSLPANLPGAADLIIVGGGFTFGSGLSGSWSVGPNVIEDFGTQGVWSAAAVAVPAPAAWPVLLVGLAGLAGVQARRRHTA